MGVWGSGNFDNDAAGDFLDEFLLQLIKTIEKYFLQVNHTDFNLDELGDAKLMPSVDILLTLCEVYETYPQLETEKVVQWKHDYLQIWDEIIDHYGPKDDYKRERRQVIEGTFDSLEAICHNFG